MEKWQENEPVSLMTFSSSSRVLRPFGTSHSELRKALYEVPPPPSPSIPPTSPLTPRSQIETEDRARVSLALRSASSYLMDHCGLNAPGCQVILVADGDCPFDDVAELEAAAAALQPSTTVHVVAMGTDAELARCERQPPSPAFSLRENAWDLAVLHPLAPITVSLTHARVHPRARPPWL